MPSKICPVLGEHRSHHRQSPCAPAGAESDGFHLKASISHSLRNWLCPFMAPNQCEEAEAAGKSFRKQIQHQWKGDNLPRVLVSMRIMRDKHTGHSVKPWCRLCDKKVLYPCLTQHLSCLQLFQRTVPIYIWAPALGSPAIAHGEKTGSPCYSIFLIVLYISVALHFIIW